MCRDAEMLYLAPITGRTNVELKAHTRKRRSNMTKMCDLYSTCNFKVSPHDAAPVTMKMSAKFTQIPVNSSGAITGHKLQGLTKDSLVVYEWDSDTCWIYVVLSRVRTLKGLYLIRPIRKSDIKAASKEYLEFMERMETLANLEVERFRTFHKGELMSN
ncbi:hypothetical protein THAOC_29356 [Thalassiosira oceanica]|uniref:Uncharacterized protein n=1 Tax=Thalassiosira oceanica TaxID=159749 RepID=K0RRB8_THAOC|nr:hypothetical protein THAOC_29356 [Thalassiosira oceanica]|eukprot:EJK51466.1 hypothetical protein THAOC_29356 [Thalassiosira oceanica]